MKRLAFLAAGVLTLVFFISAQEAQPETKYTNDSFARLSYISGNAYVQRASDVGYEEGQVNMPIAEGDRIGTTDGRVELLLGRRNYLRLDQNTKVDMLALPRKDSDEIKIRVWSGNIYLDIASLNREKGIEVLTSDATFYVLDKGVVRVDVRENKETEIFVLSGVVEASGEEGSMLVKKDQSLIAADGRFPEKIGAILASAGDDFDGFYQNRSSIVNKEYAKRYLPEDLANFEGELDEYGDWIYTPDYGYVWSPRGMGDDWRPYYNGRWSWLPMAGYTWIPYEPWGWAPFHYGRWQWGMGYGWYWIPMNVWGPGWVNWWWNDFYYGWAPMSYWGYPGILYNRVYYGRGWTGDYPYDSRALTVVHKNQLQAKNIRNAALDSGMVKSIGRMNLTERALTLRPANAGPVSMEKIENGKQFILRRDGQGTPVAPARAGSQGTADKSRALGPSRTAGQGTAAEPRRIAPRSGAEGRPTIQGRSGSAHPPSGRPPITGRVIRKRDGEPSASESPMTVYPNRAQGTLNRSRIASPGNISPLNRASGPGGILGQFLRNFSGSRTSPMLRAPSSSLGRSPSFSVPRFSSPAPSRGMSSPPSAGGRSIGGGGVRKK
jgi:hypothetical protein